MFTIKINEGYEDCVKLRGGIFLSLQHCTALTPRLPKFSLWRGDDSCEEFCREMLCPEVWNFSPPATSFKFKRGSLNEAKTQCTDLINFHYFNHLVCKADFVYERPFCEDECVIQNRCFVCRFLLFCQIQLMYQRKLRTH